MVFCSFVLNVQENLNDKNTYCIFYASSFDGGNVNVALINYESETEELVEMLLQNIETFHRAKGRMSTREGQWVNAFVNT